MLLSYIEMIAICALRISQYIAYAFKYFAIYCQYILQYIVYCNNILYIATIFKISRQYLVYRDNISQYITTHPKYIATSSKVYSATAIYYSNLSRRLFFANSKKNFVPPCDNILNDEASNITIYCSLGIQYRNIRL